MPLYEYECAQCRTRVERLRRMADADEPTFCPNCPDGQMKRRVAGGHFELKGGGWFSDGYQKR